MERKINPKQTKAAEKQSLWLVSVVGFSYNFFFNQNLMNQETETDVENCFP